MYRVARIDAIAEAHADQGSSALVDARKRLERLIAKRLHRAADDTIPKEVACEDLVHAIAQHLEPLEKQALLECDGLLHRCRTLIELLDMRMMTGAIDGKSRTH
jgi:hypothetical protein